jgi:hypothetical protein
MRTSRRGARRAVEQGAARRRERPQFDPCLSWHSVPLAAALSLLVFGGYSPREDTPEPLERSRLALLRPLIAAIDRGVLRAETCRLFHTYDFSADPVFNLVRGLFLRLSTSTVLDSRHFWSRGWKRSPPKEAPQMSCKRACSISTSKRLARAPAPFVHDSKCPPSFN